MKQFIKSAAKRILFGDREIKNFPPVRIANGQVAEKVLLSTKAGDIDVSDVHCIVCHSPFSVAIRLSQAHDQNIDKDSLTLSVISAQKVNATAKGTIALRIPNDDGTIIIIKIEQATCFQTNRVRQFLIREYFKNKNSRQEDAFYAALYSFPRRVIAVSFSSEEHSNIFPMDFQCFIKASDTYILGLRTTNVTLEKIIGEKKVLIGDTDTAALDTIYLLGKHHSGKPPALDQLPFSMSRSTLFNFPVAEFSAGYKEIEIIENRLLGTHMLMIGKVKNEKQIRSWQSSIYHIHFFESFAVHYPKA